MAKMGGAFIPNLTIKCTLFRKGRGGGGGGRFIRKGRLIERGVYLTNHPLYGGVKSKGAFNKKREFNRSFTVCVVIKYLSLDRWNSL